MIGALWKCRQQDAKQADLLIISGVVTEKLAPHLKALYESMRSPKYVLAVGTCANSGGLFSPQHSYSVKAGASSVCPWTFTYLVARQEPEAIMDGLIALQERIRGKERQAQPQY